MTTVSDEQAGIAALARNIARESGELAGGAQDARDAAEVGRIMQAVGALAAQRERAASILAQIDAAMALHVVRL